MGWSLDPVTDQTATPQPAPGQWQLDPVGESYVPNAAEKTAADASRSFDNINKAAGQEGVLYNNGVTVQPTGGTFVRQQGASPTDSMNQSQFVPDHVPGYNPKDLGIIDLNGVKHKLPDWAVPYGQEIQDFGIGVADTLSNAVSLPIDGLINAVKGTVGQDILSNPSTAKQTMKKWLSENGVPNESQQAFDTWWSDLGSSVATQGILSLGLIAGAGPIAAMGSAIEATPAAGFSPMLSTFGAAGRNIGTMAQKFPGQVLAGDALATVGGATAPMLETPLNKLGVDNIISDPSVLSVLGSLIGGLTGASVSGIGRVRPGTMDRQFGGMPRFGGKAARSAELSKIPNNPIVALSNRTFNPAEISRAVSGYQTQVTDWITERMGKITAGTKDPAVAADRMVQMMDQAWKKARRVSNTLWGQVDQKSLFDPTAIRKAAIDTMNKVVGAAATSRFLPTAELQEIISGSGWVKQTGGDYHLGVKTPVSVSAKPITIDRARQMQSVLGSKIAEARKVPGTQQIVQNMVEMSNSIGDALEAAFPNNNRLREAKEFTKWLHSRFDMGPTGQFGQVRLNDAALTDSRSAMQSGMRHSRFGKGLADIGQKLGVDPAVAQRTGDYLKSTVSDIFHSKQDPLVPPEIAQAAAARASAKYMNSPDFKRLVKEFPALQQEMSTQTSALNDAISKQLEVNSSKFFRMAGTDPEKAAEALLSSGTKIKDIELIKKTIGNDADAMDALTFATVRKLGGSVNWNPTAMKNLIHSKDNMAMLSIMCKTKPGQLERMSRVLDSMAEFEAGPIGKRTSKIKAGIKTSGRIIGLVGARLLGAHTIQSHAIGAQIGSSVLADLFNIIPPEAMMANALTDPRWERFVLTKVPENIDQFRRTSKQLGALVGAINAGHRQLMDSQPDERK